MRFGVGVAAVTLALACAQPALAAQRFASPTGSGTACTAGSPCSAEEAVRHAKSGDEAILKAGTYPIVEGIYPEAKNVSIHGDLAAPMPTLKGALGGQPLISAGMEGSLSYIELDNLGDFAQGAFCFEESTVERLLVRVNGKSSTGVVALSGCSVRDSLLLATGSKSIGLLGEAVPEGNYIGRMRNLTVIAGGPESIGMRAGLGVGAGKATYTMDVRNSIAQGDAVDLYAAEPPVGREGEVEVIVGNSNFDRPKKDFKAKFTESGGNQTALPLFLNAAAGDYREAAGSPTIDAGLNDSSIGPADLAGAVRVFGSAPDIGAYEFVPQAAPPAEGELRGLTIDPRRFRAAGSGEAVLSRIRKPSAPVGARVSYTLTAAATVLFKVERKTVGRRVKGKCVKRTKANAAKKKCRLFKLVKGSFVHAGAAGNNRFKFSGRLGSKALKPGFYRLVAGAGHTFFRQTFTIVK